MRKPINKTCAIFLLCTALGSTIALTSVARRTQENPREAAAALSGGSLVDSSDVVLQDGETACGNAALTQLYRLLAIDEPPRNLPAPDPETGLTLRQLQEAALHDGVQLIGQRLDTRDLTRLGFPFIAWVDGRHFVVVEGLVSDGRVSVLDPAVGRILYHATVLRLRWDGTALVPIGLGVTP
jgi:ABC-type bacteriocin/lantibiotic exporter with double-glycine peptidase domain